MTTKACAQILSAFTDWVDAEKAKSFLATEGAMLDSRTTVTSAATTTPPAAPKSAAAAALLSTPYLFGLAVVISIFC
jgi:hypothetical protein